MAKQPVEYDSELAPNQNIEYDSELADEQPVIGMPTGVIKPAEGYSEPQISSGLATTPFEEKRKPSVSPESMKKSLYMDLGPLALDLLSMGIPEERAIQLSVLPGLKQIYEKFGTNAVRNTVGALANTLGTAATKGPKQALANLPMRVLPGIAGSTAQKVAADAGYGPAVQTLSRTAAGGTAGALSAQAQSIMETGRPAGFGTTAFSGFLGGATEGLAGLGTSLENASGMSQADKEMMKRVEARGGKMVSPALFFGPESQRRDIIEGFRRDFLMGGIANNEYQKMINNIRLTAEEMGVSPMGEDVIQQLNKDIPQVRSATNRMVRESVHAPNDYVFRDALGNSLEETDKAVVEAAQKANPLPAPIQPLPGTLETAEVGRQIRGNLEQRLKNINDTKIKAFGAMHDTVQKIDPSVPMPMEPLQSAVDRITSDINGRVLERAPKEGIRMAKDLKEAVFGPDAPAAEAIVKQLLGPGLSGKGIPLFKASQLLKDITAYEDNMSTRNGSRLADLAKEAVYDALDLAGDRVSPDVKRLLEYVRPVRKQYAIASEQMKEIRRQLGKGSGIELPTLGKKAERAGAEDTKLGNILESAGVSAPELGRKAVFRDAVDKITRAAPGEDVGILRSFASDERLSSADRVMFRSTADAIEKNAAAPGQGRAFWKVLTEPIPSTPYGPEMAQHLKTVEEAHKFADKLPVPVREALGNQSLQNVMDGAAKEAPLFKGGETIQYLDPVKFAQQMDRFSPGLRYANTGDVNKLKRIVLTGERSFKDIQELTDFLEAIHKPVNPQTTVSLLDKVIKTAPADRIPRLVESLDKSFGQEPAKNLLKNVLALNIYDDVTKAPSPAKILEMAKTTPDETWNALVKTAIDKPEARQMLNDIRRQAQIASGWGENTPNSLPSSARTSSSIAGYAAQAINSVVKPAMRLAGAGSAIGGLPLIGIPLMVASFAMPSAIGLTLMNDPAWIKRFVVPLARQMSIGTTNAFLSNQQKETENAKKR